MSKRIQRLLISIMSVGLCSALLIMKYGIWMSNDDGSMMQYLAGYTYNTRTPYTFFMNVIFGSIVSGLYGLFSGLSWYVICMLGIVVLSIIYTLYLLLGEKGHTVLFLFVFLALSIFSFINYIVCIQWTVVAAFAGMATITFLLLKKDHSDRRSLIIPFVFFIISVIIREQVGLLTLSCALFILFIRFLDKRPDDEKGVYRKKVVIFASVLLISSLFCHVANSIYERYNGYDSYRIWHGQLGDYIDYGTIEYNDDNAEAIDQMGWDKELLTMVNGWFFMDHRTTGEAFEELVSIRDQNSPQRGFSDSIKKCIFTLKNDLKACNIQTVTYILTILLLTAIMIRRKGLGAAQLLPFGMIIVFVTEAAFLLYRGRFPERVYQALILIFLVPTAVYIIGMSSSDKDGIKSNLPVMTVSLIILILGFVFQFTRLDDYRDRYKNGIEIRKAAEEYATDHQDNIYIYDGKIANTWYDPLERFNEGKGPHNLFFWGGANFGSPLYHKQLEACGIEELYSEDFLNDNVFFYGVNISEDLCKYMEKTYPGSELVIEEETDEHIVYCFR